jgi:hypothetical protein
MSSNVFLNYYTIFGCFFFHNHSSLFAMSRLAFSAAFNKKKLSKASNKSNQPGRFVLSARIGNIFCYVEQSLKQTELGFDVLGSKSRKSCQNVNEDIRLPF